MHVAITRWIRRLAPVLFGLVLLLALTNLDRHPLTATLDSSHVAIGTFAAAKPLQFGRDIIFTYGPLGHLVNAIYSPKLFGPELAANIAINILFVIILWLFASKLPPLRRVAFLLVSFLAGFYSFPAMVLLMLVAAAWLAFAAPNQNRILLVSTIAFAAMATLIKGTFLFFAVALMTFGIIYLALRRETKLLLLTSLSFAIAFLASWFLSGQQFSGIPSYLSSSLEVMKGFPAAMTLVPRPAILVAGVIGLLFASIQIADALIRNRSEPRAWFISLVLWVALFLVWKSSYTRADAHTVELFYYGIAAVLALPIFYSRPALGAARILDWAIIVIVSACGIFVIRDQTSISPSQVCRDISRRMTLSIAAIAHPGSVREKCAAALRRDVEALQLPQIKQAIGQATVDVFGYEQAIAVANDLNYTPRSTPQGFSAFTAPLVKINSAFYTSAQAPEYVIFKLETLDSRFAPSDDAETLLLLAEDYRPVLVENGYTLLRRQKDAGPISNQSKIGSAGESSVGRSISVPRGVIWCELSVRETFLGALISFLYQPPQIWVEFETTTRQLTRQRIVPGPAANGFLINPFLQSDRDFVDLVNGNHGRLEIQALKVLPSSTALLHPDVRYRFSEIIMSDAGEKSPISR
jgi:hypothetical protein